MGLIGCPKTSVRNSHSTLRNIPEKTSRRKPEVAHRVPITKTDHSVLLRVILLYSGLYTKCVILVDEKVRDFVFKQVVNIATTLKQLDTM
jgi:hypothetical protein